MATNGSAGPPGQSVVVVVIYSATLVQAAVCVAGNALVVGAVLTSKKLRHKEMTPLVMLALADAAIGFTKAYQLADYLRQRALSAETVWRLYTPRECFNAWTMSQFAATQAQAAAMLLLSVDRLVALAWFERYVALGRGYTRALAGAIVGYAALMLAVSVAANRAMPDVPQLAANCLSAPKLPVWWETARVGMQQALGVASVITYLVVMAVYLRRKTSAAEGVRKVQLKRQKRLTVTLSLVTAGTILFFCVPYAVSMGVKLLLPRPSWKQFIVPLQFFALANSSVNVFIYIHRLADMREAMTSLLRCKNPNHNNIAVVPMPK